MDHDNGACISDLVSSNGTKLNGIRLKPNKRNSLKLNDEITLGSRKGYLLLKKRDDQKEENEKKRGDCSFSSYNKREEQPTPASRFIFTNYEKVVSKKRVKKKKASLTYSDSLKIIRGHLSKRK